MRNVLGHLGLKVTRLIRVSFGPFQLGELREGDVEEVRTRVLREQLGEKLARLSGADFSAPRPVPPRKPRQDETHPRQTQPLILYDRPQKPKKRASSDHAWRAHEEGHTTKKLRRRFRGARSDIQKAPRPEQPAQAYSLSDRKGRAVGVERYARTTPPDVRQDERGARGKSEHRRRNRRPMLRASSPPRGKR